MVLWQLGKWDWKLSMESGMFYIGIENNEEQFVGFILALEGNRSDSTTLII